MRFKSRQKEIVVHSFGEVKKMSQGLADSFVKANR